MADTIKITTLAQLKVALQAAKTYIDGQIDGLGTLAGKSSEDSDRRQGCSGYCRHPGR